MQWFSRRRVEICALGASGSGDAGAIGGGGSSSLNGSGDTGALGGGGSSLIAAIAAIRCSCSLSMSASPVTPANGARVHTGRRNTVTMPIKFDVMERAAVVVCYRSRALRRRGCLS